MKTSKWLVEYAKAQVGKPYWYGCYGQKSSEKLLAAKKSQYPTYYKAKDFQQQMGVKVHDCAGLFKGALWCKTTDDPNPVYHANQDLGANGFYNRATVKGAIKTFPKTVGLAVFKGSASKKTHIGVYIGDDKVIEAKGHAYGVITSKFTGGGWTYWAECPFFEYEKEPTPAPTTTKYKVTTKKDPLALREKPTTKSKALAWIPKGTIVEVYGISGNWADTLYAGKRGWCYKSYLTKV